jgi:hypothetical protein
MIIINIFRLQKIPKEFVAQRFTGRIADESRATRTKAGFGRRPYVPFNRPIVIGVRDRA